ncbi:hypothetical protein BC829DRAFT_380470 [Chytridium lagenaria]|nr:hypothetical protein BC829DRAFT_380470 [Chytridium lagenaria]
MSFLFTNPFDDVVDKATSENNLVGQEDIVKSLEIADKIRGKEVPAKQAIQSLKRRINNKNPNVQIQALKLADACVKNSGHHFVVEVASRDFIDNLVSITRNYPSTNQDVRLQILKLLQTWGLAFKGKSELSYVTETYESMKREGIAFPPVERAEASSIMIDTLTAPEWTHSEICMRCRTQFTTFNRKHHCRNCGQTFCHACSSRTLPLPSLGITQEVRVCDSCHYKLTNKVSSAPGTPNAGRASSERSRTNVSSPSKEDEELEKAIAASLAEADKNKKKNVTRTKPTPKPIVNEEEEDPELKAAIEASLAELKISEERRHAPPSASSDFGGVRVEIDNLKMFVELVERLEADVSHRGIGVIHNSQISTLYSQLMILQPKLLWSLDDAVTKYRTSIEMNEKITAATQMYDRLLQERLAAASGGYVSSTLSRGYSGYGYPQPHQPEPAAYGQNPAVPWGQPNAGYPQEPYPGAAAPSSFAPPVATGAPYPNGPYQPATDSSQQQQPPPQQNAYQPQPPLAYAPTGPQPTDPYAPQPPVSQVPPQQSQPYTNGSSYATPSTPAQQYTYTQPQPTHTYYDQAAAGAGNAPPPGPMAFGGYAGASAPGGAYGQAGYAPQQPVQAPAEKPTEALLIEF